MIINNIVSLLATQGFGVVGKTLFIGELPLNVRDCTAVVLTASPEPDKIIPYYRQTVDVWTRYSKAADGYQKIQNIFNFIHQKHHYTMGGYYVYLSYALGGIDDLDRDVERRKLYKASFEFVYRAA